MRTLTLKGRHALLQERYGLSQEDTQILTNFSAHTEIAEHLIENAIGYFSLPLGIATHFRIDGRDLLIPMAVEETSIIAAASATAKWIRTQGSITTQMKGKWIIGQIQLPQVKNPKGAKELLAPEIPSLIAAANTMLSGLVNRGGGVAEIIIRDLGEILVLHVLCDPCDAMGANLINQVCEGLKPLIEKITGERVGLCILSNLVDGKLSVAEVTIRDIEPHLADRIVEATLFAKADPYRAATHNKGILNGVDPILIATGNDWRAVEAGVHAYAARSGQYQPLSDWQRHGRDLVGRIELPMAVGTVGGMTRLHPIAGIALKILGVQSSDDLARICAAVGLVQNLGALKALSTVGIVRGHMELHASNLALAAGSTQDEIGEVRLRLNEMLQMGKGIGITAAQAVLQEIRVRNAEKVRICNLDELRNEVR